MIALKKMDDKGFVFVNKPLTKIEDQQFSGFLKYRKLKSVRKNKKTGKMPVVGRD